MNFDRFIYLDNAATTFLDPEVEQEMVDVYRTHPGNSASNHRLGLKAATILERARSVISRRINCSSDEVVFCSGGTEANNMAIQGILCGENQQKRHFIVSSIEHSSVLSQVDFLKRQGFQYSLLPVDSEGIIRLDLLNSLVREDTCLVSVMHVNSEIGTVQPIADLGRFCESRGLIFHVDACQSFTKEEIDFHRWNISLLTISAHKIHGPTGVGALVKKKGLQLQPLFWGGNQEGGVRSGTVNVVGAAGFAKATQRMSKEDCRGMAVLRDSLWDTLEQEIPGIIFNGSRKKRVCNNVSFSVSGFSSYDLMRALERLNIIVSTGSACSSGSRKPSHVLEALGRRNYPTDGIRVTLSRSSTENDLSNFVSSLKKILFSRESANEIGA